VNSSEIGFSAGWNRRVFRRDQIGLHYQGELYSFDNISEKLQSHTFEVRYFHPVARRAVIQLGVGPQLSRCDNCGTSPAHNNVFFATQASIDYSLRRLSFGIAGRRSSSGGSGVLNGSLLSAVDAHASRSFGRVWSAALSGEYARNSALSGVQRSFYSRTARGRITRQITARASTFAEYRIEAGSAVLCQSASCDSNVRQIFGFGVAISLKPLQVH
jgi:hypothetical protein